MLNFTQLIYCHNRNQMRVYPFILVQQKLIATNLLVLLVSIFSSCNSNNAITSAAQTVTSTPKDSILAKYNTYFIGDVNNDRKTDSAYVVYYTDTTGNELDCMNKNCEVRIKFTPSIPDLVIEQSLGVYVQKTTDLTRDYANEVILFSRGFEGFWNTIYVFTLKDGNWKELARTKAFIAEDKDTENRIIQLNSNYYLVGDGWDDAKGGVTERTIKIKVTQ